MIQEEFNIFCKQIGFNLDETQQKQFAQYAQFLKEKNQQFNLTAITDDEGIYKKHFIDCILPLMQNKISGKVLDIGSGAGFPGVVWKIVNKDLDVTLLEANSKRCSFLEELISLLNLKNIKVLNGRAEELAAEYEEEYDYVSARAVASIPILLEIGVKMLKINGEFILMRGSKGEEEIKGSGNAIRKLNLEIEHKDTFQMAEGERNIYYLKKVDKTDKQYPRQYGFIKRRPL